MDLQLSSANRCFASLYGETPDLTLSLQAFILTFIATILTILLAPIHLWWISRDEVSIRVSPLFWCKNALTIALISFEAASLRNWANAAEQIAQTSLALASLASVAAVIIAGVINYAHLHSLQSSALAGMYLSASMVFDTIRVRYHYTSANMAAFATLSKYTAATKLMLLLLDEITKRQLIVDEDLRRTVSGETLSGFWNRVLFIWLNRILFDGYRNIIAHDDFPSLPLGFSAQKLSEEFGPRWAAANKQSPYSFMMVCLRVYFWQFSVIFVPRLLQSAFTLLRPLFLKRAVAFVGEDDQSDDVRNGLVGAVIALVLGSAVSQAMARHLQGRLSTRLRAVIIMELFKKSLLLTQELANESAAVSLIGADIDSIVDGMTRLFDIFVGIIQASVGAYLLMGLANTAARIAVGTIVCAALLSIAFGKLIMPARVAWNEQTQIRVTKTSAALTQIKSLKMAGLGPSSSDYIQSLRAAEIKQFKKLRWHHLFLTMSIVLVDVMTPIAVVGSALFSPVWGGELSAPTTFGTLLAVSMVTQPLMVVMTGYSNVASIVACFLRVQEFLVAPEAIDQRTMTPGRRRYTAGASAMFSEFGSSTVVPLISASTAALSRHFDIVLSNACIAPTSAAGILFNNLCLTFRRTSFTVILGPTGSGKTTFMRTIIGEAIVPFGSVTVDYERIAYCGQTPWIFNASVRDNIIAGRPFDPVWYAVVTDACMLNEDFQWLPFGDGSSTGDNGSKLSGGQRHRVALARALYVRALVIVLDDVLSALDSRTALALFSRVFGERGVIRRSSSTVFLATHSTDHLDGADKVITIDKQGNVTTQTGTDRSSFAPTFLEELTQGDLATQTNRNIAEHDRDAMGRSESEVSNPTHKGDFSLYRYFFAPVSKILLFAWAIALILTCLSEMAAEIFLRVWFELGPTNTEYYKVLIVLGVSGALASGLQAVIYYLNIIPRAVEVLHRTLIDTVFGATLHFLTTKSHADILNRFSQDMSLVSVDLPISFFITAYFSCFLVIKGTIIVIGMKLTAPVILGLISVFILIARFSLRTSRQVRFLDLEARSPLLAAFTETASGIEHIRAFGWQSRTISRAFEAVDHSQKPFYYMLSIQRWLMLNIELLTLALSLSIVVAAVYSNETVSQPGFGLSLYLAIQLSGTLTAVVERFTSLETCLGAVARIRDFAATTPQESTVDEMTDLPENWPGEGEIVFGNVTARYNPIENFSLALNNISIRVAAGETVGVIGRTGSGKSSMILTLLNFLERSGSITIDGIDISRVPHEVLRSRITTVSQEPVSLHGTVRDNLMPYKGEQNEPTLHDGLIDDVLGQVHLLDFVNARGGVDEPCADMGFSHGQKQLLSIGRAMLHHMYKETKIILMDEPTSSMDNETDAIIQDLIRDEFIGCTVMVISHRKDTIRDADMFLEFSGGSITSVTETRRERELSPTPSSPGFSSSGFSSSGISSSGISSSGISSSGISRSRFLSPGVPSSRLSSSGTTLVGSPRSAFSGYSRSTASTSRYLWGHLQN